MHASHTEVTGHIARLLVWLHAKETWAEGYTSMRLSAICGPAIYNLPNFRCFRWRQDNTGGCGQHVSQAKEDALHKRNAISQACTTVMQTLTSRTAGVGAHRECVRSPHVAVSKIQG